MSKLTFYYFHFFAQYFPMKHGRLCLILSWDIPNTLKMECICCLSCFNTEHLRVAQRIKKQSVEYICQRK